MRLGIQFLHRFHLEVMLIHWGTLIQTLEVRTQFQNMNICKNDSRDTLYVSNINLQGSLYRFSLSNNLVVEGCNANVAVKSSRGKILGGCSSVCTNHSTPKNMDNCYGDGCCHFPLCTDAHSYYFDYLERDFLLELVFINPSYQCGCGLGCF